MKKNNVIAKRVTVPEIKKIFKNLEVYFQQASPTIVHKDTFFGYRSFRYVTRNTTSLYRSKWILPVYFLFGNKFQHILETQQHITVVQAY